MEESLSIKEWMQLGASQLQGDSPRLEAELLLAHVLSAPRSYLHAHSEELLNPQQAEQFQQLLARRRAGEPIAYILKRKEFWSLDLYVNPHTLIPRPETELLVELALAKLPTGRAQRIADLGTGSGAIALALAKARPHWQVVASDQCEAALGVAAYNAEQLNIQNVGFYQGDWCSALPNEPLHAVISNPPYLAQDDPHLKDGGLDYEPVKALVAGKDGLSAIKNIICSAHDYLLPGGWLMLEHGATQRLAVTELMQNAGYMEIQNFQDYAGHDRVVIGRRSLSH